MRSMGGSKRARARVAALIVCAGSFVTAARADDAKPQSRRTLSLSEVLDLAPKNSYAARRAQAVAAIGYGERDEARSWFAPSVTAGLGLWRVDGATQSSSTGEFGTATYSTANPYLRVGYALNPVASYYELAASSARADALDARARVAESDVRLLVIDQYFAVARANANRKVADQALADDRELQRIAEVLERGGTGRGDDVARAKSAVARAEQNVVNAERAHTAASIALATTLDLDVSQIIVPAAADLTVPGENQDDADAGDRSAEAVRLRPETAATAAEIEAERAGRRFAWADLLAPDVQLYFQQGALGPDFGAIDSRREYGVFVSWTFSLSDLSRVSTAGAKVHERELAAEESNQTIRSEVQLASEELRLSRKRLAPAAAAVAAAEDAIRIVRVRFQNGDALVIEILDAQRELELARLEQVEAIAEYNRARVRLDVVTGNTKGTEP